MSFFLPSRRTVRDYKNIIRPKAGFDKKDIDELIIKAIYLKENKRYMSFIMDEIKVQQNFENFATCSKSNL